MSIRHGLRRTTARAVIAGLMAVPLLGLTPALSVAASSGGWNNLGHGPTATSAAINGKVETYLPVGNVLYVGGDFTNAGGLPNADHIAKWNGSTWSAIGGGLGDAASAVYAIAVDGNHVYAGGSFQNAGGDSDADKIAVYDGTHWRSLVHSTIDSPIDGPVFAMAIIGRTLFIGGGFDNANGDGDADSIVAYNMDTGQWTAMLPHNAQLSTVSSIVPDGHGGLFVGDNGINMADVPAADFVAEWNGGTSWTALGTDQAGTNGALKNRVRGLARSGGNLYVVGDFTDARGIPAADNIARWDGTHWSAVGPSTFPTGSVLYGVLALEDSVFVVGYFKDAGNNKKMDSVAAFVNGQWTNVGSNKAGTDGPVGLNSTLFTVSAVGSRLYVGGLEQQIGGSAMNAFGAWFPVRRPDALISAGSTFAGNGIYNTTAASQTVQHDIPRGTTHKYWIQIDNDGLVADTMRISGPGSANGFVVKYVIGFNETDVTAQVVAGTYQLRPPARGGILGLAIKVTVKTSVPLNTSRSWLITETSIKGGVTDAVRAVAKATN